MKNYLTAKVEIIYFEKTDVICESEPSQQTSDNFGVFNENWL